MEQGKLNFSRNQILGKEELVRNNSFLENKILRYLKSRLGESQTRNIYTLGAEDDFEVSFGANDNEVTVTEGFAAILDQDVFIAKYFGDTNFALDSGFTPAGGDIRILGVSASAIEYEQDITVSVSGTSLTDSSGLLSEIIRDMSNYDNTKIKFAKLDGTLINDGVYDVVEVNSSTLITLSSDLSAESDLKPIIVGTYDLEKINPTDAQYSFVLLELGVYEVGDITDDIVPIAKLTWSDATTFTIDNDYRYFYDLIPSYFEENALSTFSEVVNAENFKKVIKVSEGLKLNGFYVREPVGTLGISSGNTITIPYYHNSALKGASFFIENDGSDTVQRIFIQSSTGSLDIDGLDVMIINQLSSAVYFELRSLPLVADSIHSDKSRTIKVNENESIHLQRRGDIWQVLSFPQTDANLSTEWTEVTYESTTGTWSAHSTYGGLFYKKEIGGAVKLSGAIESSSGSGIAAILPTGYRPTSTFYFQYYDTVGGASEIGVINLGGAITLPTAGAIINVEVPTDL